MSVTLSLLVYTALSSTLLIVGNVPSVKDYMHSWEIENNVLEKLKTANPTWEISLMNPACVDCDKLVNMTEDVAVQKVLGMTWTDTEVTSQVETRLASIPQGEAVTVVALDFQFEKSLIDKLPNVVFKNVLSNSITSSDASIIVSTEMASYTDGVLAGLTASTGYKRVGILVVEPIPKETFAFWQGVMDADPDICVIFDTIPIVNNFTWSQQKYELIEKHAVSHKSTDVLYTNFGAYDMAVFEVVKNRTESNYAMYVITGTLSGVFVDKSRLGEVWLSRSLLDWDSIITAVGIQGKDSIPSSSQSQWTAPWSTRISKLSEDNQIRKEYTLKCPGNASVTHSDIIKSMMTQPIKPINENMYTPNMNSKCQTQQLPILSPFVRQQVTECLAEETGKVRLVGVAMYINNLGNVDMKRGSFYVDFNLYLHQSKTVYATMEGVEAVLAEEERLNGMGACTTALCSCPDLGTNKWENYIPHNETENFNTIVNLVNVDRIRTVTPVYKLDAEEPLVDYYRVQGTHYFMPELKKWPMDSQSLRIILEDLQESTSDTRTIRFCHMIHFAGLSPNARYFPGMELSIGDSPWAVETTSTCWPYLKYPANYVEGYCSNGYAPADETLKYSNIQGGDLSCKCLGGTKASSRYTLSITFERPAIPSFMKSFLPAIFIILVNQGVWFLHPKVFETRLGVCGSSLISGVMYHVSITSNTPETSVLTLADRFMVVVYFNNLVAFVSVFYQTVLYQGGLELLAWKSFRLSRIWGPLVTLCTFLGVGLVDSPRLIVLWVGVSGGVIFFCVYFIGDKILKGISPKFLLWMQVMNQKMSRKKHDQTMERVFSTESQSSTRLLEDDDGAIQLT